MRFRLHTTALLLMISAATAQVASHSPASPANKGSKLPPAQKSAQVQPAVVVGKPVARVNGTVLTDRDLVREMYAIFPYASQHNGFPKDLEPEIRKGALEMIIFEELVYQEAVRRRTVVPPAKLNKAKAEFRKQFPSADEFQQYLAIECQGSEKVMLQKIRRSLLIETLLKSEVGTKAAVTPAQVKAYFDKNKKEFTHTERFSLQTISIMPPEKPTADNLKEAQKRADEALKAAKATKTYQQFGLLAEKMSDDDWHVNMGDRKYVDASELPPPLVEEAHKMKTGDVSDEFHWGNNYTIFRLNDHKPAGVDKFETVKKKIREDLEKSRYNEAQGNFNKQLRKSAKVEVL